mgnify:CR=1 FL=1
MLYTARGRRARPEGVRHHTLAGAQFSSLLVRQANRLTTTEGSVLALPAGTSMVKRLKKPDVVAQPVKFQTGINAKGVKAEQAWKYPNFQVVRAHTKFLGTSGREYTDPRSDGLKTRRLQESNFFITINPNKKFAEVDAPQAAGVMWKVCAELFSPENIFKLIVLGPKDPGTYAEDLFEDVIRSIETTPTVEVGEKQGRMHSHIIVEVEHFSQVQINLPLLRASYKAAYNRLGAEFGMQMKAGLSCKIDMIPQSNWAKVSKQYVKKALLTQQPDLYVK